LTIHDPFSLNFCAKPFAGKMPAFPTYPKLTLNIPGFLYLLIVAPILSVGFGYWIYIRRKTRTHHQYSLFASMGYVFIFWVVPLSMFLLALVGATLQKLF
jgi:hypothetical protein